MKKLVLICISLCFVLFGCGSGSLSTSGTLSVTAPKASNGVVTATATFSPSTGSALPGQAIDFRWYTVGVTSKTQSVESTTPGTTDKAGTVTLSYTLPVTRSESIIVYVIATTGGLSNKEGWQSVVVTP